MLPRRQRRFHCCGSYYGGEEFLECHEPTIKHAWSEYRSIY
jgi:hypothetical protein